MPNVAHQTGADAVRNMAAMTEKLGLPTAPAAKPATWPTGVSLLAQAIASCQRCDAEQVCADWLVRAPKTIEVPPAFCANAAEFERVKRVKQG